ncbi:MAG: FtsQ-type POTRA domain-containing protein [Vampirovibrionales bacterium]|nr:FtsQ-type POTRA domain-containing protein [Vampirovibrionales bacterium]
MNNSFDGIRQGYRCHRTLRQHVARLPRAKRVRVRIKDSIRTHFEALQSPPEKTALQPSAARQHRFIKRRAVKQGLVRRHRAQWLIRLGVILACWIAIYSLLQPNFWQLSATSITLIRSPHQQNLITAREVHKTLDTEISGRHLLMVSTDALSKKLQTAWPLIAQAKIEKLFWPARLQLTITEKPIWAYSATIQPGSQRLQKTGLVSRSGDWFAIRPYFNALHHNQQMQSLPRVLVASQQSLKVASTRKNAMYWNHLQTVSEAISRAPGFTLQILDCRQPQNVVAWVKREKWPHLPLLNIKIGTLDATTDVRMKRFSWLASTLNTLGDSIIGVDLRWSKQVSLKQNHLTEATFDKSVVSRSAQ